MTIPYVAIAIIVAFLAILLGAAILAGLFEKKGRTLRAELAELTARRERDRRILNIFAEREGHYEDGAIEGEFVVLRDIRKAGF